MRSPYAIELQRITKRFPQILANDNINLQIKWGTAHSLVGENGAGKSTLMKILYGMQAPTSGVIRVDGQRVRFSNPKDAIALGIGMVHQHFMLVNTLTVTENVILGAEPGRFGMINYKVARARVAELIEKFQFGLDPDARISDLTLGLQQKVEILKTLYHNARILILDEPTAVLTPHETDELFYFLCEQYIQDGNAVIFISHKLNEVRAISDEISVMRRGQMVATMPNRGTSNAKIAEAMIGRSVRMEVEKKPARPKRTALSIKNVVIQSHGKRVVDDVSFSVRAGEIVGIAGVEGNGQSELIEAITGLRAKQSGTISYLGETVKKLGAQRVAALGVAHIPEDRNERGLVASMNTAENLLLGQHNQAPFSNRLGIFSWSQIEKNAHALVDKYDVRPRAIHIEAGQYSGGNAQKLVVAREMQKKPKILIAAQPTRGVDVGAIEYIHQQIVEARDKGLAVLLVSADLNEIINLSDRILVMFKGKIMGELLPKDASEHRMGLLMTGIIPDDSAYTTMW